MDLVQAILLALVQGLTEILPISSSGHLVLVPHVLGWPDQGLAFDVALHVGTLIAVLFYFRREVARMLVSWTGSLAGRPADGDSRLAWLLLLSTVPAVLAGLLFGGFIEARLRSPVVVTCTLIGYALLMGWADRRGASARTETQVTWRDALLIGCAQALALVPGTSRSGVTMTAGRLLGLTRLGAARFSFLMSIPVIAAAGGYEFLKLLRSGAVVEWDLMGAGMAVAFASTLASIHLLMRLVPRFGLMPFVVYRLLLGGVLIYVFF